MSRIAIPLARNQELDSPLSSHFGKAPHYMIYNDGTHRIVDNTSDHFGGTQSPPQFLIDHGVDVLIVKNMGNKALQKFQEANVKVFKTHSKIAKDVISDFEENKLDDFDEGCSHH